MKHGKLVIAVCGAVGLLDIALPVGGGSLLKGLYELDKAESVIYAAIFVLPLMMGVVALIRPPMLAWQSGVALAGFVIGFARFGVWRALPHVLDADAPAIVRIAAIVVGAIASIAVLLRPETATS